MSTETATSPAAVVQAGFEAFGKGDVAGFGEMFHADATWNHRNDDYHGGMHHGREGILAFIAASGERTAGTLRAAPLAVMTGEEGRVSVLVRVSATRPDGRAFDDTQILLFAVDGDRVRSVDQFVGDPRRRHGILVLGTRRPPPGPRPARGPAAEVSRQPRGLPSIT